MTYRFGDVDVDVAAYEVRRGGARVRLTRQPMELLLLLVAHPQQLVTREQIAARLWGPEVFTDLDAGIHTAVRKVRQALGDSLEAPRFIETVSGKGYRFIAPVIVVPPAPSPGHVPGTATVGDGRSRRHHLPLELSSFVGRRKELLELPSVLASTRLLSLTGAGGVGKTRLAVRIAAGVAEAGESDVYLIDLAPLSDPGLVGQAVAAALNLPQRPDRSVRDTLLEAIGDRRLLLVLDTCEHLVEACADLAADILRVASGVQIIATSREPLGVAGETVYRVPSLAVPDPDTASVAELMEADATQLFVTRAAAADPAFVPTPGNAGVIARICGRLDGIPLAIELAAARIAVLSPEQLAARLHDRFRLLTGGGRAGVARQRTLEATIDWSYDLLSGIERQLLHRLSVFPAGWTLSAAERVCDGGEVARDDVLDVLTRLVSKSLVVVDREVEGERWYRCLDTVRQFAGERLVRAGEVDHWRDRQFAWVYETYRDARPVLRGPGQLALLRRLQTDEENVRAALDWGITSPHLAEPAVELAGALFWFWTKRGQFDEGRRWLERALGAGATSRQMRGRALIGLANIYYFQRIDGRAVTAEALACGREVGDPWVISVALFIHGLAALERGDLIAAHAYAVAAREAADAGGGPAEHGGPLYILGHVALANGDYAQAQRLYDEAIDVSRQGGEAWGLGVQLVAAAAMHLLCGDDAGARAQVSEALALFQELEDPRGIAWTLQVAGGLFATHGDAEGAARLWAASGELLRRTGTAVPPNLRLIHERYHEDVERSLGEARFTIACDEGRRMSVPQAIASATAPDTGERTRG